MIVFSRLLRQALASENIAHSLRELCLRRANHPRRDLFASDFKQKISHFTSHHEGHKGNTKAWHQLLCETFVSFVVITFVRPSTHSLAVPMPSSVVLNTPSPLPPPNFLSVQSRLRAR